MGVAAPVIPVLTIPVVPTHPVVLPLSYPMLEQAGSSGAAGGLV